MKYFKFLALPLMTATLILSGCTNSVETQPSPPSEAVEAIKPLTKDQVVTLLNEAAKLENDFYAKEAQTTEELYTHFQSLYTHQYIDSIILGSGNLKKENEKWVLAHMGGEFIEGTFMNQLDLEGLKIETSSDGKTITITNPVGDGLYAPHQEVITLVYADNDWKIDQLEWIPIKG